jgi:hypothetical protein
MTLKERVEKRYYDAISKCLEARLHGIYMTPISKEEIRKDEIRKEKVSKTIGIAKELESLVQLFKNAQKLYSDKGFAVDLIIDLETGLISKWNLRNKFPKGIKVDSGRLKKVVPVQMMSVQEFNSIVDRLGDRDFSSKDIMNALIGSGIGVRKLQPTLGNILKGLYGEPLIEKANEYTRGPGVRYRKVK